MRRQRLLWLIPVAIIAIAITALLALPAFVASSTHRASIEALASSLTGRRVHIGGHLSLALLPSPVIIADNVTITGPDQETINARSLTLDISLGALLHGQLSATNLAFDAPDIAFPWPLPGGATAIAPPNWLAALKAQIHHGTISLGAAHFTGVDADLVTGANGAVTISGTGNLQGRALNVSIALGAPQLTGIAPLTLDGASGNISVHFAGGLDNASTVSGQLDLATPQISGTASIIADGTTAAANALQLTDAKAIITGTASLDFDSLQITADIRAQNLDLGLLQPLSNDFPGIPLALVFTGTDISLQGQNINSLQTKIDVNAAGLTIHNLQAILPGNAALTAHGQISPTGDIAGQAGLTAPDLPALLAGYSLTPPAGWTTAHLTSDLSGNRAQLNLGNFTGNLGPDHLTGNIILGGGHAAGMLAFDRLDLRPLVSWLGQNANPGFTADGEITAAHASFGPLPLTHLAIDAGLTDHLNIRHISASLYGGLASGSVALDGKGLVTAARGFLSLPSAAPLAALLPASWQPPAALSAARLNLTIFAQGAPAALATSMVATIGDFTVTAAPILNLPQQTAAGPLSLRHPDAIAAFKIFGHGGTAAQNLAWPGPGSIALRADFTASSSLIGLPDFVLSMGNLTANGRVLRSNGVISGQIDAGTLAVPPLPADPQIPWSTLATIQGKIDLAADQVLYAGNTILGSTIGSIALAPQKISLDIAHASLANGNLSANLTAATSTGAPVLSAKLAADHLDASLLNLPLAFPLNLPTGLLGLQAELTASGYSPRIWIATLGGTASLTAANGTLNGFNLTGLASALTSATKAQSLRTALAAGTSHFTSMALAGKIDHGNCTLTTATLTGPDGAATATGSIDIFDRDIAIDLELQPIVTPPLTIGTTILGSWAGAKQVPKLQAALGWAPGT